MPALATPGGRALLALPRFRQGLLAYYSCEDGTAATITDLSGNGHSGTWVGTPASAAGVIGNALALDGSTTQITLDSALSALLIASRQFTISGWGYLTAAGNFPMIFSSGSAGIELCFLGTQRRPNIIVGGTALTAAGSVALSTFVHLLATSDGATLTLYVNGIPSSAAAPAFSVVATAALGGRSGTASFDLPGRVDEVGVWGRWSPPDDVALLYSGGAGYRQL